MADSNDLLILDEYFEGLANSDPAKRAWRVVRSRFTKAKRISNTSLPRVGDAALNFVRARESLDKGIATLPPGGDVDRYFESARRYLQAGIESLGRSFAPTAGESFDSTPPPKKP